MKDKVTLREIISNDTPVSSMRWAFYHTIRLGWAVSILIVLGVVANVFLDKDHPVDLSTLVTLNGAIYGIAYTGKAVQSFSKNDTTPTDQK